MSSFWSEISKDRERKRRQQRQADAWVRNEVRAERQRVQREDVAANKANPAEEARRQREAGLAEAERRNEMLAQQLARLAEVLRSVVGLPARTLSALRAADAPSIEFEPLENDPDDPWPQWPDFAPPEPAGRFGWRRYERAAAEAHLAFTRAGQDHDLRRRQRIEAQRLAHEVTAARLRREHEQRWDAITAGVLSGDSEAVAEFAGAVLHSLPPLAGLLAGGRAVYQTVSREVLLELEIPDTDAIPAEKSWRYVPNLRSVEPQSRTAKDAAQRYANLIAQITLAAMHASFRAMPPEVTDAVTINGHVRTTDPATGRSAHPCLITVTANRTTFDELVLDHERLEPPKCLAFLGAELSPHPYEMQPVEPFIDFDLAKYRLVSADEALVALDNRVDLVEMNPYEFERLVKDLFTKIGYETWRTTSSRDDGIDAVAVRADPLLPVECVIQAKRFRHVVPPKEVQALIGAMAETGTATHGVLVTTSWLSDRSRQRARAKRIVTIEQAELAFLIEKHLDRRVVFSNRRPPTTRPATTSPT